MDKSLFVTELHLQEINAKIMPHHKNLNYQRQQINKLLEYLHVLFSIANTYKIEIVFFWI